MKKLLLTASTLSLCTAGAARAQEIFDLDEITVSSTKAGIQTPLDRTGATVQVITQEELEQADETTLAEFLARQPGISVSANGGVGASTNLRIRGLGGAYIKVLVNGIDVTDPSSTQTQFDWGGMTTANLGRVEILKGSSSSLYGSRAVGGVVNISTIQRPDEPGSETTFALEGGSYETYRGAASYAYSGERGGLTFGIDRITTDGFSAKAGDTEKDGYQGTQLTFSADVMATEALKLGMSAYSLEAQGDFDGFSSPYTDSITSRTRAVRTFAQLDLGAWQHELSLSYYKINRVYNYTGGLVSPFAGKRKRVDYVGNYTATDQLSLTFGADWEEESFNTGSVTGSVETTGLFGEVLYAATADLDLSASVRLDDHSTFGDYTTGRLAAAYRLTGATTLRAVAATGFRAPSLDELYGSFFGTPYGNSAFVPEESTSFELGVEHEFAVGRSVKATAFHNRIENLIQYDLTTWKYIQVQGESTTKGWSSRGNGR